MKKYKAFPPETTIANIRTALHKLGLLLHESHILHRDFYSCRVILGNKDLLPLNIGTNGKGRSFEYSLASGYAEFMERLQNQLLLNSKKMLTSKTFNVYSVASSDDSSICKATYSLDEQYIETSMLDPMVCEELARMSGFSCSQQFINELKMFKQGNKSLCVPFYDVQSNIERLFPIEILLLLTGSNGMASGNTPKEAILQSICEIFERFVISELYWKGVTPPTIPLSSFSDGHIKDVIIRYIEENEDYTVAVKDCSLGLGIPAVGLLIIDKKNNKYNFKIGVDFVPEVELERCFTEIHQGRDTFGGLPYSIIHTSSKDDVEVRKAEDNLMKIFIDGTGFWPISILRETPSYDFEGFNEKYGLSNSDDIRIAINLIHILGYNIYIRNNSTLGFPAYYVVVPGMSQIIAKNPFVSVYKPSFIDMSLINQLGRVTEDIAGKILHSINENYEAMKSNSFALKNVFVHNTNEDLNELSVEMLATLLALYVNDRATAIKYLELYLVNKDKIEYQYYYACLDYLKLRGESQDILKQLYGIELTTEVCGDLDVPHRVLQHYSFPNCPDCNNCKLRKECRQHTILAISEKVKASSIVIDQRQTQSDIWDNAD